MSDIRKQMREIGLHDELQDAELDDLAALYRLLGQRTTDIEILKAEKDALQQQLDRERNAGVAVAKTMEQISEEAVLKRTVDALQTRLDEAIKERELAIAHDRQPYPTAWAYEQVCKALEAQKTRLTTAEAELDEWRNGTKRYGRPYEEGR